MSTTKSEPDWDEASAPEISVAAVLPGAVEDGKFEHIVGERFGKYLLVGEIAMGGMAELFLGVHKGLEAVIKVVVIKRVLPHFSRQDAFVRMFVDEARLAARLDHPNIVRTYEFGEVDGQYFTAMEFLPGEDLCKVLNKLSISRQRMPLHAAVAIASQICTGLQFAHQLTDTDGHSLHLVHRDINPANVVLTYGGEVKIIDFGVAKSTASRQTLTGTIKGKIAYMPPEQVLGRPADQRADMFSAGVVLWEMLTGRPLFLRDNEAATLYAIMKAPIPPASQYRPDVPPALDAVLARALARSPAERFATADDMAAALDVVLQRLPRYDARSLGRLMEELFGSTSAEAKRSIAQTRSLSRNVSLVMKLRSEVRAELAEYLDAAVREDASEPETLPHPKLPAIDLAAQAGSGGARTGASRAVMFVLAVVLLGGIAAGVIYMMRRPESAPATPVTATSSIQVDSTPQGAAVFAGGEPTGLKTPATLTGITARQLVLRLELPGHEPVTENLELAPGTSVVRHLRLTAISSRVVLAGLPAGAAVFLDDVEHAAGEVMPVAPGRHVIRIVVDGRTVAQQSIDADPGDQGWRLVRGKLVPN